MILLDNTNGITQVYYIKVGPILLNFNIEDKFRE